LDALPLTKNKNGYTLMEALVSLVMISLVTLGGLSFYRNAAKLQRIAMHKRVATEIANSKLEDLRRTGYLSLPDPATVTLMEDINVNTGTPPVLAEHFGTMTVQRSVTVDDILDPVSGNTEFKKVDVLVSWQEVGANNAHEIQLTTYITP